MAKRFIRRDSGKYSKLGRNRRKLQVWRRPKGRDSQTRLQRKGYPGSPMVGFKKPRKEAGKINGLYPILITNLSDLNKLDKTKNIALISRRLGVRKKIEIIKVANEMKIKILNVKEEKK